MSEQQILDELRTIRALVGSPDTDPGAWSPSPQRTHVTRDDVGNLLGEQILDALNINCKNVTRIALEVGPQISVLTIERVVFSGPDLAALKTVFERFAVIPADEAEVASPRTSTTPGL